MGGNIDFDDDDGDDGNDDDDDDDNDEKVNHEDEDDGTKTDETFNPKNYIADFGPLNWAFSA